MGAKIDMLAIPLPFIVTLLLSILAAILWLRNEPHEKPALYFVTLCVLTTSMVGLRWTFDIPLFRLLQPILASFIQSLLGIALLKLMQKHDFILSMRLVLYWRWCFL